MATKPPTRCSLFGLFMDMLIVSSAGWFVILPGKDHANQHIRRLNLLVFHVLCRFSIVFGAINQGDFVIFHD